MYKTEDERAIEFVGRYGYQTVPYYDYDDFIRLEKIQFSDMDYVDRLKKAAMLCCEHGAGYQEMAYTYKIDEQELHDLNTLVKIRNRWLDGGCQSC